MTATVHDLDWTPPHGIPRPDLRPPLQTRRVFYTKGWRGQSVEAHTTRTGFSVTVEYLTPWWERTPRWLVMVRDTFGVVQDAEWFATAREAVALADRFYWQHSRSR